MAAGFHLDVSTVRQLRTSGDSQNGDIQEARNFLREWQTVVAKRLTKKDRQAAAVSRALREQEFERMRHRQDRASVPLCGYARSTIGKESAMSDLELAVRSLRAIVDAQAFSEALKNISLVLKKSDILILEEASVRFSGGRCILTATDMTTWMIAEIPASGDDFSFIFSRTKKLELVCRRFDGSLTMEWTENTARHDGDGLVRLSCGSRTGEFNT